MTTPSFGVILCLYSTSYIKLSWFYLQTRVRICDIIIYNKKYVFGFHPVSGTELSKPLKFLSDESNEDVSCYADEATFRPCLKMVIAGEPSMWLRVCTFGVPQAPGRGEELEWESTTNSQCLSRSCLCNEDFIKTQKYWVQSPLGWWTQRFGEIGMSEEGMDLCALSPYLPSSCSSVTVSYNKWGI